LLLTAYQTPNPHISKYAKHVLQSSLQWTELFLLAKRWQIRPHLYHFIKAHHLQSCIPDLHLKSLHEDYQRQAMQTIFLKRQIQDINHHFTKQNIHYCLIKGAELIQTIYKDTPVRSMSDIDLLCYPKDINAITKILTNLGYFQKTMHQSHELQAIATYRKHYPAFFHNHRHTIEVHFNLFPDATNQSDLTPILWAHARAVDNTSQFRLDVNHHLLYLCHHLTYHIQSPREGLVLYWFFDIYQWIKEYHQSTIQCPLFLCLNPKDRDNIEFVYNIIENQWTQPERLDQNFIHTDTDLEKILNKHLKEKSVHKIKRVISYYQNVWFDKHPQWSYCERLLYWLRLIFPQRSYLKDRYQVQQKWMLPLYCLVHPFLVIRRAIKRLIQNKNL